jgi:hypothetical protein
MAMIQSAGSEYPAAMISTADHTTRLRNRISWGAVLAGVATALVVQMLLNMLGLGIGMATLDAANTSANPSASTASMTAAGWWIGSGIVASLIGGVAAGRLSGTSDTGTARWHGLVSWCATTLCLMYLLTTAIGGVLGGTVNALGSTVGALGRGAATAVTGVAANTDGDALQAQARRLINPNDAQSAQDSVVAYIRASVSGDQAAADRARDRAVDAVARAANVSPDEARTRLQQAEQQVRQTADQAKQAAQQAAETARKSVATAGFTGFIALVLGAVAAWFGGGFGAPRGYREV